MTAVKFAMAMRFGVDVFALDAGIGSLPMKKFSAHSFRSQNGMAAAKSLVATSW